MRLCASKSRGSVASWTRPTASASSRHTMDSACSRTSRCCRGASTSWTASTRTPSTSSTSPEKWANSLYLCVSPFFVGAFTLFAFQALAKFQTSQKVTTKTGIEQEDALLNESAAMETSLNLQILELENETKQASLCSFHLFETNIFVQFDRANENLYLEIFHFFNVFKLLIFFIYLNNQLRQS